MPRLQPLHYVLIGLALLLLLIFGLTYIRRDNQDRLRDDLINDTQAGAEQDAQARCASNQTYDLIKRELFRRAAELRGSDRSVLDSVAASAVVRMENPVLEGEEEELRMVRCAGSLSLDLPPGVAVVGGRRTLTADVDYALQPAADSSGTVVTLSNADAIIAPLATLANVQPPPDPLAPVPGLPGELIEPDSGPKIVTPPQAPSPPTSARPPSASPSFNCLNARTRGEIAVCANPALAALDRQMAAQFGDALAEAGSGERALLQRTRVRFLRYRDSCRTDACVADAYRGRMAEIRDIMAGRWQP